MIDFKKRIEPLIAYYNEKGTIGDISRYDTYFFNGRKVDIGALVWRLRKGYKLMIAGKTEKRYRPLTEDQVAILDSMGFNWKGLKAKTFEERIAPLTAYYNEYGSLSSITTNTEYEYKGKIVKVGTLCANLKAEYKKGRLSEEEVTKLNNMGFNLVTLTRTYDFYKRVYPLVAYYEEFGTLSDIILSDIYTVDGKEYPIGILANDLREQYKARTAPEGSSYKRRKALSDEQVKFLEDRGMIWKPSNKIFDLRIYPLVKYYQRFGTLKNIVTTDVFTIGNKKYNVGALVSQLRADYKMTISGKKEVLNEEQIKRLEDMGMEWKSISKARKNRFMPLINYYESHGTLGSIENEDVYFEYDGKKYNAKEMIRNIRIQYNARFKKYAGRVRPLSDEEVELLELMHFPFVPEVNTTFESLYRPLYEYHMTNGDISKITPLDTFVYHGKNISLYENISILNQRYFTKTENIKLKDWQIKQCEDIGMKWVNNSVKRRNFLHHVSVFKAYQEEVGSLDYISRDTTYVVDGKEYKIGLIAGDFRRRYAHRNNPNNKVDALTDEEVEILKSLGFKLDIVELKLAILKDYYQEHHTLSGIKYNPYYEHENKKINVDGIVTYFKELYANKELDQEYIEQLKSMNFEFGRYARQV